MALSTRALGTDPPGASTVPVVVDPTTTSARGTSLWRDAVRRLVRNRLAMAGGIVVVVLVLGAGLMNIFIAIGLTGWVGIARQTRAQVLALKEKEFVDAARGLGAGFTRLLTRHILPNALTPIVVAVTFGIPEAIFTEAALSFIGVGITPPTPSGGQVP